MKECSICKKLRIVVGDLDDYKALSHYHYRDRRIGPYAAIFTLKPDRTSALRPDKKTVGVIVYTMPTPGLQLRNIATDNLFVGFDKGTQLALVNKNIRSISRVIIEPRFRSLGLASRLVRETMAKMDVPIIEAMAVMGLVNPFFEKAGMTTFTAKMPARCIQLLEAFSMAGIEKEELIDPREVQYKLDRLGPDEAEFIELQINRFLQSYGKRRYMSAGVERTGFVLSKLTARPVYYIWFNENLELRI